MKIVQGFSHRYLKNWTDFGTLNPVKILVANGWRAAFDGTISNSEKNNLSISLFLKSNNNRMNLDRSINIFKDDMLTERVVSGRSRKVKIPGFKYEICKYGLLCMLIK